MVGVGSIVATCVGLLAVSSAARAGSSRAVDSIQYGGPWRNIPHAHSTPSRSAHTSPASIAPHTVCAARARTPRIWCRTRSSGCSGGPRFLRRDEDLVYLLRVLRNTWISSKRSKREVASTPAGEEIEAIEAPHDPIAQAIEGAAVYEALQELTQPLREALVAVDVMGLSYREAARALGTREGTIMSRLHRGRGQIAARLEPDG